MSTSQSTFHATVNTELVIFSVLPDNGHSELRVFLVSAGQAWRLPGGAVEQEEALDAAAARHCQQQFHEGNFYTEQLFTFGEPNRYPDGRVISVTYFVLVPNDVLAGMNFSQGQWFDIHHLPRLEHDHQHIIAKAHRRLAAKIGYSTLLLQLMPKRFTFGEMQCAHECITGTQVDKRNYRKRIQTLDCITETGQMARRGNHRPAMLYKAIHPHRVDIIK